MSWGSPRIQRKPFALRFWHMRRLRGIQQTSPRPQAHAGRLFWAKFVYLRDTCGYAGTNTLSLSGDNSRRVIPLASVVAGGYIVRTFFHIQHSVPEYMSRLHRPSTSAIVLTVYLLSGAFVELGHRDPVRLLLRSCAVLTSHTCGSEEIHLPLDQKRHCLACVQSTQRVSIQPSPYPGTDSRSDECVDVSVVRQLLLETDVLYTGKRGPPLT